MKRKILFFIGLFILLLHTYNIQIKPTIENIEIVSNVGAKMTHIKPVESEIIEDDFKEQIASVSLPKLVVTFTELELEEEIEIVEEVEIKQPAPQFKREPVIEIRESTTIQAIPFNTQTQNDSTQLVGYEAIIQAGQEGQKTIIEQLTLTDGIVTSRVIISEVITKQPIHQIIAVGTKVNQPAPVTESGSWLTDIINLTNQYRQAAGVSPLSYNPALDAGANLRAQETSTSFSHTRPNGTHFSTAFGVGYSLMGENIAAGYNTASSVMDGWANSSGHYSNMINPSFTHISAGRYEINGCVYWVMILHTP